MLIIAKAVLLFISLAFAAMAGMFTEEKHLTKKDESSEQGFCFLAAFFVGFVATFL